MPRKKTAAGQQDSSRVAQIQSPARKKLPFYYEYIDPTGRVVYLDEYEWSSGMGITHKEVKKAQASRKREVKKGFADTKEA